MVNAIAGKTGNVTIEGIYPGKPFSFLYALLKCFLTVSIEIHAISAISLYCMPVLMYWSNSNSLVVNLGCCFNICSVIILVKSKGHDWMIQLPFCVIFKSRKMNAQVEIKGKLHYIRAGLCVIS